VLVPQFSLSCNGFRSDLKNVSAEPRLSGYIRMPRQEKPPFLSKQPSVSSGYGTIRQKYLDLRPVTRCAEVGTLATNNVRITVLHFPLLSSSPELTLSPRVTTADELKRPIPQQNRCERYAEAYTCPNQHEAESL